LATVAGVSEAAGVAVDGGSVITGNGVASPCADGRPHPATTTSSSTHKPTPSIGAQSWNQFFFSSRRRHTRLQGDSSSDVCSSDLYGMLLFVVACGLSVTLGLMNFVNLAHGAFAMAGGYITVILVNRLGLPFLASLPLAFLFTAVLGAVFERTLYVHVYGKSPLEQVLFTIGLVFMSVAAVDYVMGSQQQFVTLPG